MTYWTHFRFSTWIAWQLLKGASKAFLHAVVPAIFAKSTTALLVVLAAEIRKAGCPDNDVQDDGAGVGAGSK